VNQRPFSKQGGGGTKDRRKEIRANSSPIVNHQKRGDFNGGGAAWGVIIHTYKLIKVSAVSAKKKA